MKTYIFILGHSSDLAKQEIFRLLTDWGEKIEASGTNFVMAQSKLSAGELMNILGGTVKIGEFLIAKPELTDLNSAEWLKFLSPSLDENKKNNFGFSIYNAPHSAYQSAQRLALETKKQLRAKKYKARLVTGRAADLSSVIVTKNDLLDKELIIIRHENKWLLGLTRAVQDFGKYSERDMGRPARDNRSGMLPPKVAQMMINLAGPDRNLKLLDPFCGSGTVLQEALLLGYDEIHGTDLSPSAVKDCRQNLEWLRDNFGTTGSFSVEQGDARDLSQKISSESIDLIVSEPFMGDARFIHSQYDINNLRHVISDLENLYHKTFIQFHKILKTRGQIVFAFPIFSLSGQKVAVLNQPSLEKIGFQLIRPDIKSTNLSANNNLVYSREHQLVQREITVWKKL